MVVNISTLFLEEYVDSPSSFLGPDVHEWKLSVRVLGSSFSVPDGVYIEALRVHMWIEFLLFDGLRGYMGLSCLWVFLAVFTRDSFMRSTCYTGPLSFPIDEQ